MKYQINVRDSFNKYLEVLQEIPEKGNKFPTVILVSGFGMDLHESGFFDEIAEILYKNGFQTFQFSFEGTGKSEGNFVNTTIETQSQQFKDILEYVRKDRYTNSESIGILAQSFGTVIVTAALPLPSVKTVVFTSPPFDPYAAIAKWFKRQRGFNPDAISEIEWADKRKTRVGPQFWISLQKYQALETIKKLTQSILIIHGSKDKRVPLWQTVECFSKLTVSKKLHIVKNGDHAFTNKYRLPVLNLIAEWFNQACNR